MEQHTQLCHDHAQACNMWRRLVLGKNTVLEMK